MTASLVRSGNIMRAVFSRTSAVLPACFRRSLMNMPPSIAGLPSTMAAPKSSNSSSSNSSGVQSCQTPDDWIEDANAELAEWFGEEQQTSSVKRGPAAAAAGRASDPDSSSHNKPSLTEFLLKQKQRSVTPSPPAAAVAPPQIHSSVAHNSSSASTNNPARKDAGAPVVHHHTHTHYHHYPASGVASSSSHNPSTAPAVFASRATIEAYARRWVNLWNARDLEGVLRLFSDRQCVFVSPRAQGIMGKAVMRNKEELRTYWATALKLIQILEFEYLTVLSDADARIVQVVYRARTNGRGYRAVELWELDEEGLIVRGEAMEGVDWKFDTPDVEPIDPTVPGYGIGESRER